MADKDIKAKDAIADAKSAAPVAAAPVLKAASIVEKAAEKPASAVAAVTKPVAAEASVKAAAVVAAKPVPAAAPVPVVTKPVAAPVKAAVKAPANVKAPVSKAPVKASVTIAAPAVADQAITEKTKPAPVAAPAAKATPTSKEAITMESTIKNTTDKAQAMFVEMNDRAKAALEKTQGMFADVTEFNKGNVEALVESSKIAAKGIETMGQDAAEYTRKSFENMTAIVKSLSSVKSPTEFMKLHSDYVRTSFDSMVAESSKTTENMLKLAGEIAQPISNRVAIAAEKIKISA